MLQPLVTLTRLGQGDTWHGCMHADLPQFGYLMCVLWWTQLEPYADKDLRNVLKRCYKKAKRMAKLLSAAVAKTADADKNAVSPTG